MKATDAEIEACFDKSQPLAERLREVADVEDHPAWMDQFLYDAAVEVEARDQANTKFIRGLADMHEAARADVDRLRGVLAQVDALFKKTRRFAEAVNSRIGMVELEDVAVLEVSIDDTLATTVTPKEKA